MAPPEQWIAWAFSIAGITLCLYALSRSKTYGYAPNSEAPRAPRARVFRRLESPALVAYLASMIGACACVSVLLTRLMAAQREALGVAEFVFTPPDRVLFKPAILAGIFLPIPLLELLGKKLLGADRYNGFVDHLNAKAGINSLRLVTHLGHVSLVLVVTASVLLLNNYCVANEKSLVLNRFFRFEEDIYRWREVDSITLQKSYRAWSGRIVRDAPYYTVAMRDGVALNFRESLLAVPWQRQNALAGFAAKHSGREIVVKDPYPLP